MILAEISEIIQNASSKQIAKRNLRNKGASQAALCKDTWQRWVDSMLLALGVPHQDNAMRKHRQKKGANFSSQAGEGTEVSRPTALDLGNGLLKIPVENYGFQEEVWEF